MNTKVRSSLKSLLVELIAYGALVTLYFFLVLHLLGGWLNHLFQDERKLYAFVALGLIVGQGWLLELLTRLLLNLLRARAEEK